MFKQEIISSNPLPCKTLLWEKLQLTNILHSNIINSKDLKKRKSQENLWDVIYNNILVFYIVQFNIGNIIFHFTQWRKFIGLNIHIREGVKIIIIKSSSDPEKITHEIMLPRVAVGGACSAHRELVSNLNLKITTLNMDYLSMQSLIIFIMYQSSLLKKW